MSQLSSCSDGHGSRARMATVATPHKSVLVGLSTSRAALFNSCLFRHTECPTVMVRACGGLAPIALSALIAPAFPARQCLRWAALLHLVTVTPELVSGTVDRSECSGVQNNVMFKSPLTSARSQSHSSHAACSRARTRHSLELVAHIQELRSKD